jgi:hypothetical protein
MFDRVAQWQPDRGAAVAARTVGVLALIALAVIHVVDLPGTATALRRPFCLTAGVTRLPA